MRIGLDGVHRAYVRLGGRRLRYLGRELRQRKLGRVVVNSAGIALRIDPADMRAQRLFARGGVLDANAVAIWGRLFDDFKPTIVLDVGANYGEVALSRRYPPGVQVHLIEANPRVAKLLAETIRPLSGINVHHGAATDKSGTLRLYGARVTSGLSTVKPRTRSEFTTVDAFRLDQRIAVSEHDRLLFKIDVEGAEVDVLRGMTGLLECCNSMGMVEIAHLDVSQLGWLQSMFRVRLVRVDTWQFIPLPRDQRLDSRTLKRIGVAKDAVVDAFGQADPRGYS